MLTAMNADMCNKCLVTDPWVRSFTTFPNPVVPPSSLATEKSFECKAWLQFFRHNLQHERREHKRRFLFFGCHQIGPDFVRKRRVDSTELLQSQKMDLNESGRPLPHVIARSQTKNSRHNRAHGESVFR